MRKKDGDHLNDDQIAAALAGRLDRVAPRRDLWPSIRAEAQIRQLKSRRPSWLPPWGPFSTLAGAVLAFRPAGLALGSVAASLVPAWLLWAQPWQENLVRHGGEYWSAAKYDGFFQREGVNPLVDTGNNIRCSFNVNVDTASYIKARRTVQEGLLPDPASVRVEDFINHFAQEYSPTGEDTFDMRVEGGPSPFGGEQPWFIRFGLQGQLPPARERQVIATDAKAWIEFNDKVVSHYRQLGYEYPRVSHETNTLVASEVRAGHSVTALWEVEFHQGAQGRAATVYVSYVDSDTGDEIAISRDLDRKEFSTSFENASPQFQLDAIVAEYAEILRESYWARDSSLAEVRRQAQRVSALLPDDPDVSEFVRLVARAERTSAANAIRYRERRDLPG